VQIPRGRPSLHQTIKTSKGLQSLDEDGMRHDGMPTPHLRLRHVAQQLPEALIPFVEQKDPLEAHFDTSIVPYPVDLPPDLIPTSRLHVAS